MMRLRFSKEEKNALRVVVVGIFSILIMEILIAVGIILFFPNTNPNIAAGIIAATATICVSVFSVAASKILEMSIGVANEHRAKKIPIYEEFISFLIKIVQSNNPNSGQKPVTEKEMIASITKFSEVIIVWGSNDVIRAWYAFRHGFSGTNQSAHQVFVLVENIVKAIRKELGHSPYDLKTGELLGVFVNDIETYFKDGKAIQPPSINDPK